LYPVLLSATLSPGLSEERSMAGLVKVGWFGRQVSVLMINGKSITGELTEVSEHYVVITRAASDTQVMAHAIVAIRLAGDKEE
jgi:small nuclear ribonucleoprotein (snRNP)-like protein